MAIFTHFYSYVDQVWLVYNVGTSCILGRAPFTKETAQFSLNLESWKRGLNGVVPGYPTSTNIPRVDGLSTDPREMGRHKRSSTKWNSKKIVIDIFSIQGKVNTIFSILKEKRKVNCYFLKSFVGRPIKRIFWNPIPFLWEMTYSHKMTNDTYMIS